MRIARSSATRIAGICSLLAGALYLVTSPADVGWFDAPELAAAGQQLGVAHAPGEPVYVLLLRLAQLLPLGDLAARAAWLSAAIAAALVGTAVLLAREIWPEACASALGLWATGLLAATCGPLWTQGTVIELYGLQALLVSGSLLWIVRSSEGWGGLVLAGLLGGLGLAVNPLLTVLAVPAGLILVLGVHPRPPVRAVVWAVAAAALGASVYVYLPLRSAAEPGVWFGGPLDRPSELFAFVSGQSYARSFARPGAGALAGNVGQHLLLVGGWLGWPAVAAGVVGVVAFARRPLAGLALLLFGVGAWASTVPRPTLEVFTPDVAGYLLPSSLTAVLLAGAGIGRIARRWTAPAVALLVVAVAFSAMAGARKMSLHRGTESTAVGLALLEAVPPGGLLLTGSDSTSLPVMYLTTAGRRRPDVLAASVYGTGRHQLDALARRHPGAVVTDLARLDDLHPEERLRALGTPNLDLGVVGTPLLWPPEWMAGLEPAGFGFALPGADREATMERAARIETGLVVPLWRDERLRRDRQLRRLLGSTAAARSHVLFRQGRAAEAGEQLRAASALHPDPWAMIHLQRAGFDGGLFAPPADAPADGAAAAGRALLRSGDAVGAVPLLQVAVMDNPGDADLWEDLGAASFWSHDLQGASVAWDQALRVRPGSPGALAGRERLYSMGMP